MEVAESVTMTGDGLATASPVMREESSGVNVQLEGWDPQGRSPQQQRCPLQPRFSLQNSVSWSWSFL